MKRILLIEDEPDMAESIKMVLEKAGYEVKYFLNPEEGLKMIRDFDLLCLDIIMPYVSGREVLAEIARMKVKIPVIIVSAVGFSEETYDDLDKNYPGLLVGFVSKPFIALDLAKEIEKNIGK